MHWTYWLDSKLCAPIWFISRVLDTICAVSWFYAHYRAMYRNDPQSWKWVGDMTFFEVVVTEWRNT